MSRTSQTIRIMVLPFSRGRFSLVTKQTTPFRVDCKVECECEVQSIHQLIIAVNAAVSCARTPAEMLARMASKNRT